MKLNIISVFICGALLMHAETSIAQCNSDDLVNSSVAGLVSGYSYLKSYKIDGEPDLEKIEFSYVLTKGTQYVLTLRDKNKSPGMVMTLFDTQRNKIASNKISGAIASAISFPCSATGIYYLQYTFEPGSVRCGASALGFKR